MKKATRLTAFITAAMFMLALAQTAYADNRHGSRHKGASTTEKVLTAAAVGAVAGLIIYAATRDDDRHKYRRDHHRRYDQRRYDHRRAPRHHRPRGYVAFDIGFQSFSVGGPRCDLYDRAPRGYWYKSRSHRFYRVPFRYNPRFSRAYNAGWERGYWAGYLQGQHDSRGRYDYYDRFQGHRGSPWGYQRSFGATRHYQDAFRSAFSIGYRHAYRGHGYGHDGFGFGVRFSYRR